MDHAAWHAPCMPARRMPVFLARCLHAEHSLLLVCECGVDEFDTLLRRNTHESLGEFGALSLWHTGNGGGRAVFPNDSAVARRLQCGVSEACGTSVIVFRRMICSACQRAGSA